MTPPMTPREKLSQTIRRAIGNARVSVEQADFAADRVLTALASGSGDHAELAEIATRCEEHWLSGPQEEGAIGVVVRRADLESLIAENAALRASASVIEPELGDLEATNADLSRRLTEAERKLSDLREHRITADLLVSTLRTDLNEAERKLAEAVGHMSWMRVFVPTVWDVTEERLSEIDAFLSKEAERG